MTSSPTAASRPRSALKLLALALTAGLAFAVFLALGNWQVQRLAWKVDLIQRVDQRVHAAPIDPPVPSAWPKLSSASDEYRRVRINGHYLHAAETLVHASTRLGYGYWLLTPLRSTASSTVIINRGFIPATLPDQPEFKAMPRPSDLITVTGLLRVSEPGGGFMRPNQPGEQRWYSRDVAAIAQHSHLQAERVAPYFIDAEATPNTGQWPQGGLTVIHFRNTHLVYAITWYLLAVGVLLGVSIVARYEWRLRHPPLSRPGL